MYYGDIFADPVNVDRVYVPDVVFQVSDDGGRTLRSLGQRNMHVDNHIIWVDPANTNHLLVGNDGGLYRSFDRGAHWIFFENLPLAQFYDVDVDNAAPFYNVYGGTQDNYSLGGPSRTRSEHGILNQDWFVTQGGDGFVSRVDPEDPNTIYAELQHGVIVRYDKRTGERIGIQPQEEKGGAPLRWNWDAPFIISPHSAHAAVLGVAVPVSLATIKRQHLEDHLARSDAADRSQHAAGDGQGVGTRRGRQEHVDGALRQHLGDCREPEEGRAAVRRHRRWPDPGQRGWRRPTGARSTGCPACRPTRTSPRIRASQHDADTVYVAAENHQNGDFAPYLLKSTDSGRTWKSITGDLPARGSTYAIAEDHVDPNLLFAGTEFAAYWSKDGGQHWIKIAGVPTIAVREIAIQKRENDLVLGTFGRGIYIVDDYSPFRA